MSTVLKIDPEYLALIERCPLVPIRSKAQYAKCIVMLRELFDPTNKLSKGAEDYLSILTIIVHDYEQEHVMPVPSLNGREFLRSLLEYNKITVSALSQEINEQRSNLSAFLSGRRSISKTVALKLAKRFSVSTDAFLRT
jgi:HTH-type transcriptional regulator/antitoxin HigA